MKSATNGFMFLVLSAGLLIATITIISEIPEQFQSNATKKQNNTSFVNKSIPLIEKALQLKPEHETYTYSGTFESPYRKKGEQNTVKVAATNRKQIPVRPKLMLKGVLMKANSLAIIEDERGQTYIRGIGDTIVEEQSIVAIKQNSVVLRDRQGSYELAVQEH